MKKLLFTIAALVFTITAVAQNSKSPELDLEVAVKAYMSIFHGSYDINAGARINNNVFGIGCGYGMEYWDSYPADVRKLPVYGFYKRYFPLGKRKIFLLFGEITFGGECYYLINGYISPNDNVRQTPYWVLNTKLTPGIALRFLRNCNIYLAPTLEDFTMPGITAGLNVSF